MDHVNDDTASVVSHGIRTIPPDLYEAASKGNIEPFKQYTNDTLELLATPIKDTILHIYIASLNQTEKAAEFVQQILGICRSLLKQANEAGDTPLHLAAKFGHFAIVKVLIEVVKDHPEDVESDLGSVKLQMLRMKNNLGNTALHEAVKNCHRNVLNLLTKEDPHYSYSANKSGESPLYIAIEIGYLPMVNIILENCQAVTHEGPDGKTSLHIAVISDIKEMTRIILSKKSDLTKATDNNGWTPLHYAAYFGHFSTVQYLLECDACVAFVADKRKMTPLHLAAGQGYLNIMKEIISYRPNCCEMVDVNGWNFLHFAMAALNEVEILDVLIRNSKFKNIINAVVNAKDFEGNTPLHVLAVRKPYFWVAMISGMNYKLGVRALNKENDSVLASSSYESQNLKEKIKNLKVVGEGPYRKGIIHYNFVTGMEKGRDAQLVVATLIAAVTFTAGLTVPGGFHQDNGTAILAKKPAFQVFMISDATAMAFSLLAIAIHLVITVNTTRFAYMLTCIYMCTNFAIASTGFAFLAGTWAILTPSLGHAVYFIIVGFYSFLTLFLLYLMLLGRTDVVEGIFKIIWRAAIKVGQMILGLILGTKQ